MKTTTTSDPGNAVLSASGAAAAVNSTTTFVHDVPQLPEPHGQARVNVGGTFTGATTKVDGLSPGGTLWIPLLLVSAAGARSVGSDTPTDSTNTSWVTDIRGFSKIRVYNSAGTITSMNVEVTTGTESEFGGPIASLVSTTVNSYSAGVTFSGGTGVNTVSIPDNLASAWAVVEGSNKYIEAITTNSSEKVKFYKGLTLLDGITVTNSANTTGTSLWGASDKGAFFGATPVVKQATFTQTYSTTGTTVANATTHAITDSTAGTPSTTALAALADGTTYATDVAAIRNNFATLGAEAELTKADVVALKKNVTSLIDALQAYGLVG